MPDPDFDVSRYYTRYDMPASVEFIVYGGGLLQRTRLSAGNAILLGKRLQKEGEAILKERKK